MSTISLTGHKPSFYLQAMVDGLLAAEKMEDFKINMSSYGGYDRSEGICFGCVVTCAVMQLTQMSFKDFLQGIPSYSDGDNARFIRATNLKVNFLTLERLEHAIEDVRCGYLSRLFEFSGMLEKHMGYYDDRFYLRSENWKKQLPKVEKLIEDLKEAGC